MNGELALLVVENVARHQHTVIGQVLGLHQLVENELHVAYLLRNKIYTQ